MKPRLTLHLVYTYVYPHLPRVSRVSSWSSMSRAHVSVLCGDTSGHTGVYATKAMWSNVSKWFEWLCLKCILVVIYICVSWCPLVIYPANTHFHTKCKHSLRALSVLYCVLDIHPYKSKGWLVSSAQVFSPPPFVCKYHLHCKVEKLLLSARRKKKSLACQSRVRSSFENVQSTSDLLVNGFYVKHVIKSYLYKQQIVLCNIKQANERRSKPRLKQRMELLISKNRISSLDSLPIQSRIDSQSRHISSALLSQNVFLLFFYFILWRV